MFSFNLLMLLLLTLSSVSNTKWIGRVGKTTISGNLLREDLEGKVRSYFIDGKGVSSKEITYKPTKYVGKITEHCGIRVDHELGEFNTKFVVEPYGVCKGAVLTLNSGQEHSFKLDERNEYLVPTRLMKNFVFITGMDFSGPFYKGHLELQLPSCVGYDHWYTLSFVKYYWCKGREYLGVWFDVLATCVIIFIISVIGAVMIQVRWFFYVVFFIPYMIYLPLKFIFGSDSVNGGNPTRRSKRGGGKAGRSSRMFFVVALICCTDFTLGFHYSVPTSACVMTDGVANTDYICETVVYNTGLSGLGVAEVEFRAGVESSRILTNYTMGFTYTVIDSIDYSLTLSYAFCPLDNRILETKRTCEGWFYKSKECNRETPFVIDNDNECSHVEGVETGFGLSSGCASMSPSLTCVKASVKLCKEPMHIYELSMRPRRLDVKFDVSEDFVISDYEAFPKLFTRLNQRTRYIMASSKFSSNSEILSNGIFVDASPKGSPIPGRVGWNQFFKDGEKSISRCTKPSGLVCVHEQCNVRSDNEYVLNGTSFHNYYMHDIQTIGEQSLILTPSPIELRFKASGVFNFGTGGSAIVALYTEGGYNRVPVNTCMEAVLDQDKLVFKAHMLFANGASKDTVADKAIVTFVNKAKSLNCVGYWDEPSKTVFTNCVLYHFKAGDSLKLEVISNPGDLFTMSFDFSMCKYKTLHQSWEMDEPEKSFSNSANSIYRSVYEFFDSKVQFGKSIYDWVMRHEVSVLETLLALLLLIITVYVFVDLFDCKRNSGKTSGRRR